MILAQECVSTPLGRISAIGKQMKFDWTFLAKDLAAHLAIAADPDVAERLLRDARQDAARVLAPSDFWSQVEDEYERRTWYLGSEVKDHVRATLRRWRDGV